jgi:5-methylcytosine-specific restriction enzyme subunit McrC
MARLTVDLCEWQAATPDTDPRLASTAIALSPYQQSVANELRSAGKLDILSLARGLEVRSRAWVGRIDLGTIVVTIRPKLRGAPLLKLIRYAYRLRDLDLFSGADFDYTEATFQDLLIHQLAEEISEILARGLQRDYRSRSEDLAIPKGRIDFGQFSGVIAGAESCVPCVYHPRAEDTLFNRMLLAGLRLSERLTSDEKLRGRMRDLARVLEQSVLPVRLDEALLKRVGLGMDRRHAAYEPAIMLTNILWRGSGLHLSDGDERIRAPGFLFDMNRFFQTLISTLLRECLDENVCDQFSLKDVLSYDDELNPKGRLSPSPRPDFVVMAGKQIAAILDAKYRDIWETPVPAEMLYQLAIYALGYKTDSTRQASIIFPAADSAASEQRIFVKDPASGAERARITLRPVNLVRLSELIMSERSSPKHRDLRKLARYLAFGNREALAERPDPNLLVKSLA